MRRYFFNKPLREGIIKSRPNRFIMQVYSKGIEYECHCPSTGRIGNINFNDIACLFSEQPVHKGRRTSYTVEAISLDKISVKDKNWIGINQYKTNDYIEYFIRNGTLDHLIKSKEIIKREVKLGKSKIDFLVDGTYIEVKTFLDSIPTTLDIHLKKNQKFVSYERISQHYLDLSKHNSSILLLCFMYERKPLDTLFLPYYNDKLKDIVTKATTKGVQTWQINLKINSSSIEYITSKFLNL